jgi:hypothetical protein
MYDFRVASNHTISVPNFIIICPVVQEPNHADRQVDMASSMCVHSVRIVQRTYNKNYVLMSSGRYSTHESSV